MSESVATTSIRNLPHSTRKAQKRAAPVEKVAFHAEKTFAPKPKLPRINTRACLERYIAAGALTLEGRTIYRRAIERDDGLMHPHPPVRCLVFHDARQKVRIRDHGRQVRPGAGMVAWLMKTGVWVKRGEVVWHINGDDNDFHPANLELISSAVAYQRRQLVGAKDRS